MIRLLFVSILAFLAVSCGSDAPEPESSEKTVYEVRGTVVKIKDPLTAIIDHEEIPGYMKRMVMPFYALEESTLEGVQPGQQVEFQYHVSEIRAWIENVSVVQEDE